MNKFWMKPWDGVSLSQDVINNMITRLVKESAVEGLGEDREFRVDYTWSGDTLIVVIHDRADVMTVLETRIKRHGMVIRNSAGWKWDTTV